MLKGEKSARERFPGAVSTYCIEAMMQDRKALQAGTSHFLGQNFAKAQQIRFQSEAGVLEHAWTTSWGSSTRLIGGLIMTHSDDDGFVVPPRVAGAQIAILPITTRAEDPQQVLAYCRALRDDLRAVRYGEGRVEAIVDERDIRGGEKTWAWIKKGVPIRLEIGPRDMATGSVFMARRDQPHNRKLSVPRDQFVTHVVRVLDEIQRALLDRARANLHTHTRPIDSKEEFYAFFTPEGGAGEDEEHAKIHGGFALSHWSGDPEVEARLRADLSVTLRCIPFHDHDGPGVCPFSGKPSAKRVVWAKSY